MSYSRDAITEAVEELLGAELLERAREIDSRANGVQFLGKEEVSKVAMGVSLNVAFLKQATEWGAEYCIFHHGFDPSTYQACYSPYAQERMKLIYGNQLTIAGYHAALDMHPEIGNNAVILERLGATRGESLYEGWGHVGHFDKPVSVEKLRTDCQALFDHEVQFVSGGSSEVQTIGVCSGGAKPGDEHILEMHQKGVRLYISGETSEHVPHQMMESGIHYFVCGHYATEVFGVQALGVKLGEKFGDEVEIKFIDINNPI